MYICPLGDVIQGVVVPDTFFNAETSRPCQLILVPDVNDGNELDHEDLFVKNKKVNSRGHILSPLLASLLAHQSGQS